MHRFAWFLLAIPLCSAQQAPPREKAPADLPEMSSEAHAPLFRSPKSQQAGRITARLTADRPSAAASAIPRRNFIDGFIFDKIERDRVPHAPLAGDEEFFRRVTLDLTGRIPTPAELREFLADAAPGKRERLVDRLVGSPAFVDKWAYFLMDTFRANGKMMRGVSLLHGMFKDSLAADRPYDDLAGSIIAASGKSNYVVAAVNPIVREHVEGKPGEANGPEDLSKVHQMDTHDELAILFGKVFLGINLSCIGCHDGQQHLEKVNVYLSTKRRADFFGMAAFMGNARYIPHVEVREARMGHFSVDDFASGYDTKSDSMLRIKRFGGSSEPKFLLNEEKPRSGEKPREALARILTSNPQFARATVNMFWAKLMGFGIVDPYDEFDLARLNPKSVPEGWELQPSHPELLDGLAVNFRKSGYSLHTLFRTICNSSAYQLSARFPGDWNDRYTRYYARKYVRMLTAEELHDAIASATERPGAFGPKGKKTAANAEEGEQVQSVPMAMQVTVPSPSGELKSFLQAFGQANRGTPARPPQPSPLQPIILMRSTVVNDRVLAQKDSRLERLLASYTDDAKVVEEMFLATLTRKPTAQETALAVSEMSKNRVEGAQNVQWALLNLSEFLYNF